MTLDAAQKALSNPDSKLSDDTKKSLQWTVDNWASVAGDKTKALTLDQTQKLGTTPKDNAGSITSPEAYKNLTTISHDGQWEAITGGDKDAPLTLDAAQKALSNPDSKLSDDTKKSLQWTVDNWAAVAGDNSKSLSLGQTQKLGTTPKEGAQSSITTPEAYKNLTSISHDGQWEAITGGDSKTPLTLDAAQKALSNPDSKLSDDTKKSLQWTVDNWGAVAGDNSKTLSLDQAQKLGTTPETKKPDGSTGDGIKGDTKQGSVGDCFFLSGTKALSETDKGKQLIDEAVKSNPDGSYDVTFKKDPSKTYHINKSDLSDKFVTGDPTMQALCAAGDQYFKDHGQDKGIASGGDPRSVYELFDGGEGKETDIEASRSGGGPSKEDIKKYLTDTAPNLGKNTALTLVGTVDDKGNWAPADPSGGHVFQVTNIDTGSGTVTYTNPWNTSEKKTIKIDDLVDQMTKDGKDNGALIGRTYS